MDNFTPRPIDLSKINNGKRYEDGNGTTPETFNAPIEASAYAVEATEALTQNPDISEISGMGTPSVEMVDTTFNGRTHKKFKISNFGSFASRPNLLINSHFNVNQRGLYDDDTKTTYMADRWYKYKLVRAEFIKNKCKLTAVNIIPPARAVISQKIECTPDLIGQVITATVYIDDMNLSTSGNIRFVISALNESGTQITYKLLPNNLGKNEISLTIPENTVYIRFSAETIYDANIGDTITFSLPKVELGTFSTPLSVLPYSQELLMCERYYQQMQFESNSQIAGGVSNGSTCYAILRHKSNMRTNPTILFSPEANSACNLYNGKQGRYIAITSIGITVSETWQTTLSINHNTEDSVGETVPASSYLSLRMLAGSKIVFDAEIY